MSLAMNIVALVGTNPYPFDRFIKPMDQLAGEHGWDVFIQTGSSEYRPCHCEYEQFIEKDKLHAKIKQADVVVCHGGFGSIRDALFYNKPIVAVPKKPELGEAQDYQEELVRELENTGYLIAVYDVENLYSSIIAAIDFTSAAVAGNQIPGIVSDYLKSVNLA